MRSPPHSVGKGIMYLGCPYVLSPIRASGPILLPRYLVNSLNNFDKTDREYSLAPTDDLIRFEVTAGHRGQTL